MPSTKVESHQVWSSNVQPARVFYRISQWKAKSTKSTEPSSGRIPASLLFDFVWVLSSSCHPYHANKGTVPTHRWATGKAQTCRKVAVIVPCHSLVFWDFSLLGFVCSILLVDPLSTFSPTLNFGDLPQWVQQESTSGCDRIAVKQQEWTQWTEEFDPVSSSISNTHQIHPIWWGDLIHVETIKKRKVKSLPLHGRLILIFAIWFVSRFFFCFLYLSPLI